MALYIIRKLTFNIFSEASPNACQVIKSNHQSYMSTGLLIQGSIEMDEFSFNNLYQHISSMELLT